VSSDGFCGFGWAVAGVFDDAGISGGFAREYRQAMKGLLHAVARQEVDMVAAWAVDRLGHRFERDLIRARTGEGQTRAVARGQKMGRPPKLTPHQQSEAIRRCDWGRESLAASPRTGASGPPNTIA